MSNVLKFNMVNVKEENKRYIDLNDQIEKRIREENEKRSLPDDLGIQEEDGSGGFVSGLQAERIDIEQEPEPELPSPEQLLDEAKARIDAMLAMAEQEAALLKETAISQGKAEGYEFGYSEGMASAEAFKEETSRQQAEFLEHYEKQIEQVELTLVNTITDVFEKVFQVQLAHKKEMIFYLVKNTIAAERSCKNFLIKVSKEDYPFLEEKKELLYEELGEDSHIEIIEDVTLKKNESIIEVDGGVFDCSLDIQLDNLIKDLKLLACE